MNIHLIWFLFSLIIVFICIQINRRKWDSYPEDYDSNEWLIICALAIFPPLGLLVLFIYYFGPILIKEWKL